MHVFCLMDRWLPALVFANGAHRYTLNLASAAWVLYSPTSDLVSSGGILLGPSTNNMAEYHVVIGLLTKALDNDNGNYGLPRL